jgi:hypothetical protein
MLAIEQIGGKGSEMTILPVIHAIVTNYQPVKDI